MFTIFNIFSSVQLSVCPKRVCISTVGVRKDLFQRDPYKVPITDFFGAVRPVAITTSLLDVTPFKANKTTSIETNKVKYKYVPQMPDFNSFIKNKV